MLFPVTSVFALVCLLILFGFTANIGRLRSKHKVLLGTGEHGDLLRATRAHGNFVEYTPWMVVLCLLLELQGSDAGLVVLLAGGFLVFRGMHAYALMAEEPRIRGVRMRPFAMMGTFAMLITAAGYAVMNGF